MTQAEKLEALKLEATKRGGYESRDHFQIICNRDGVYGLIFTHDFARALFGEEPEYGIKRYGSSQGVITRQDSGEFIPWQYHLQQAVISKDPIGYMYGVVFGE